MKSSAIALIGGGVADFPGTLGVYLPPVIDLIAGSPFGLWWEGLIFERSLTGYTFSFTGPGAQDAAHWYWTSPTVGSRALTIRVSLAGVVVAQTTTLLRVHAATGHTGIVRINCPGDSITAASGTSWAGVLYSTLVASGKSVTMHGSLANSGAPVGTRTEGHAGWTFGDMNWDRQIQSPTSPYAAGGAQYVADYGASIPFTHHIVALGTNDISGVRHDHPEDYDTVMASAEGLVQKLRDGSPDTWIYVALTYNSNSRLTTWSPEAFAATFELRRRVMIARLWAQFGGRTAQRIRLLPWHAALDPLAHFPEDNNVHPNGTGQTFIAPLPAAAILADTA